MKTKHILLGLSLGLLGGFTACDVTDLNPKTALPTIATGIQLAIWKIMPKAFT